MDTVKCFGRPALLKHQAHDCSALLARLRTSTSDLDVNKMHYIRQALIVRLQRLPSFEALRSRLSF